MQASRTASLLARGESLASAGWRRLATPVHAAYPRSAPGRLASGAARVTRHSFVYRWLTKEPDPEVVVIDLRETWTVGPVIRLGEEIARTGPARRVTATAAGVGRTVDHLGRRAPIRVASVLVLLMTVPWLVLTWSGIGTVGRIVGLVVVGGSALGLRVDATWQDLAQSRVGDLLRSVFEPPPAPDERDEKPP